MKTVHHFATISEYNSLAGQETLHPLLSVIDFSRLHVPDPEERRNALRCFRLGFFAVFLKNGRYCDTHFGRSKYDFTDGTLVFIAPEQVVCIEHTDVTLPPSGHGLLFHPDLLRGTALESILENYRFFAYEPGEALHISLREKQTVLECFRKIEGEQAHNVDRHSQKLLVSHIELFLNYCLRYYERQFNTRGIANACILDKFSQLLHEYYASGRAPENGIPGVAWFATQLQLSPDYLADLIRIETGKSASDFINSKLVDLAKEKFFDPTKSIREVAYELGFPYPDHFTRFFRQHAGYTPEDYRTSLN